MKARECTKIGKKHSNIFSEHVTYLSFGAAVLKASMSNSEIIHPFTYTLHICDQRE